MIDLDALVPSRQPRVVAVEPMADGSARLFVRTASGTTETRTLPHEPWLLVSGEALAGTLPNVARVQPLAGGGAYRAVAFFADAAGYELAVKHLKSETGQSPSSPHAPYRLFADDTQQFLSLAPIRLFRGLDFADLRRLQIDIETATTPGFDFPNPEREGDAVILIAMRDSTGWECCLSGHDLGEAAMLRHMVRLVCERDPDVIEGHNLCQFDLPFLRARCRRHRVPLAWGRDGSVAAFRSSRFTAGERTSGYTRCDVHGRHVVDTFHLVQLHDAVHRDLDSFGLKAVARHFGVAAAGRTYVDADQIGALFERDAEHLKRYALDDVRETDAISSILSPSYFHQTQLVPFSYQNCVTRGSAARIDAMLVAATLMAGQGIPRPQASRPFRGGLTESVRTGVFENVWHIDVQSLYPSIIVSRNLCPRSDTLGVFTGTLRELRRFRLAAKQAARAAAEPERGGWDALQSSFKILINSFYGYTGFAQATFNDYDLAETVTASGRAILESMREFLERTANAAVVEMDTDGIYFVPPPDAGAPETMARRVQDILPEGIDVDLDATYKAMFAYKSKNYALLDAAGHVAITGAALKSRGLEPFQRHVIRELLTMLLTGRAGDVPAFLARVRDDIVARRLPLTDLAKREVLSTPPPVYREKLAAGETKRSAVYELVLKSAREYRQGDQVAFYVTGTKKNVSVVDAAKLLSEANQAERDENVPYYVDKLDKLGKKFAEFLP